MSGPAVLQISSYWSRGLELSVDLLPGEDARSLLAARRAAGAELHTALGQHLPRRFAQVWAELFAPQRPLRAYTDAEVERVAARLHDWRILPAGTEGFLKAEVTRGGVSTTTLSKNESRGPRPLLIGEVVDGPAPSAATTSMGLGSGHAAGRGLIDVG